jgi:glycosyltransferase involved in cell wall biosynthesis
MKVMQVHNFYRSSAPSGEDEVVRSERDLLRAHGVQVFEFERHNDDYAGGLASQIRASLSNVWSERSRQALAQVLCQHRPDIVHVHNTFPQISVAAYEACKDVGVPVVQTLHNFRMFCANGLLSRDGQACEKCLTSGVFPGIVHGCYRQSRVATLGISLSALVHRPLQTHARRVQRFIALTEFARQKFIAAGIPADRIGVRGNSLPSDPGAGSGSGGYALYVGRLSEEKGLQIAVDAWSAHSALELRVVGDGPMEQELRARARGKPIRFMGRQTRAEVAPLMSEAAMLIIPSLCYEGFPRVFVESLAAGTPVVASRLGGLAEIVREQVDGLLFEPGDAQSLRAAVEALWRDTTLRESMRNRARERFTAEYSPPRAFESLLREYTAASRSH